MFSTAPRFEMKVADIGDVPFRSRYRLEMNHDNIEAHFNKIVDANVIPLAVGPHSRLTVALSPRWRRPSINAIGMIEYAERLTIMPRTTPRRGSAVDH
jgi:hypothetical protein